MVVVVVMDVVVAVAEIDMLKDYCYDAVKLEVVEVVIVDIVVVMVLIGSLDVYVVLHNVINLAYLGIKHLILIMLFHHA